MRAVWVTQFGRVDGATVAEMPDPVPGLGHVSNSLLVQCLGPLGLRLLLIRRKVFVAEARQKQAEQRHEERDAERARSACEPDMVVPQKAMRVIGVRPAVEGRWR